MNLYHTFHKLGGQILEITAVEHAIDKPQDGYSRDYWYYIGKTKWNDNSGVSEGHIYPYALCADTKEGFDEINKLSELMMAHLNSKGEWRESKPKGWYADNRRSKCVRSPIPDKSV